MRHKATGPATIVGEGITGEARLYEEYGGRIRIRLTLKGTVVSKLTSGHHAVHIHETASCSPFASAKGHYDSNIEAQANPEANVSPGLGNHPYYLGDFSNLGVSNNRKGSLYTITSRVTLSEGMNTLFDQDGSALVVHELEDQYRSDPLTKDGPGGSLQSIPHNLRTDTRAWYSVPDAGLSTEDLIVKKLEGELPDRGAICEDRPGVREGSR